MTSLTRRRVLLALGLAPIATLPAVLPPSVRPPMTVAEAIRYVCDEVFPTTNHRLDRQSDLSRSAA